MELKKKKKKKEKKVDWRKSESERQPKADEYRAGNGLIYCKVCGKPKQTNITWERLPATTQQIMEHVRENDKLKYNWWYKNFLGIRPIPCDCDRKEIARREKQLDKDEADKRIEQLRQLYNVNTDETFEKSDPLNKKQMSILQRYAEQFGSGSEKYSMLLSGETMTGKTFAANCMANSLSAGKHDVFFTTARNYIDLKESRQKPPEARIWIIDDLRGLKEYGYKSRYITELIENRRQLRKPTIITSRLSRDDFLKSTDSSEQKLGMIFRGYVTVNFTENHLQSLFESATAI